MLMKSALLGRRAFESAELPHARQRESHRLTGQANGLGRLCELRLELHARRDRGDDINQQTPWHTRYRPQQARPNDNRLHSPV